MNKIREVIARLKMMREEMIAEDVNGWPNTIGDGIDTMDVLLARNELLEAVLLTAQKYQALWGQEGSELKKAIDAVQTRQEPKPACETGRAHQILPFEHHCRFCGKHQSELDSANSIQDNG